MRTFVFPNVLTVCRLLAIPLVLYLILNSPIHENYRYYALAILMMQQATDVLDGYLARRIRRETKAINRFGEVMDPLADKLYIGGTYLALSYALGFPWWITLTFLGKDLVLLIGWLLRAWFFNVRTVRPNFFGKTANALQAILIYVFLLNVSGLALSLGIAMAILFTLLAGVTYLIAGSKEILRES